MNINATILIQIINFAVVYWLLRNLLFKPVVTIIDTDLSDTTTLVNFIDQQKKSIDIQEKERERSWYACRHYFKNNRPLFIRHVVSVNTTNIKDQERNVAVSYDDSVVVDVYKALEEKIKNVH